MNPRTNAVVVATTTANDADAALRYAVSEGTRRDRPVHLLHVLRAPVSGAESTPEGATRERARARLEELVGTAESLADHRVPVTGEVVDGSSVVDELVRHSTGAALLVLQRSASSKVHRVVDTSVVHGVAAGARVPVVSVPEGWQPPASGPGRVLAAVKDPAQATELLRLAFEEARARRAGLVVLHVWWLTNDFDVVVVDGALRDDWSAQSRQEIVRVIEPLVREFFNVEVDVMVRHTVPVEGVLAAAHDADVLIVGRRHHLLPLGSHLGPVARAALSRAGCPVILSPGSTGIGVGDAVSTATDAAPGTR